MTGFPRHGLYAIADTSWLSPETLPAAIDAVIHGGASVVQLRDKSGVARADTELLKRLLRLCREAGIPFIINDDADLAMRLGADGVHLGCDDVDLPRLRQQLGSMMIGISCHNSLEAAAAAEAAGADYVAFGRFYPSQTKPEALPASLDLLTQARRQLRLPIVAIGGLTPDNSAPVLAAGADLLAVIEGLFGQPDPATVARRYCNIISQNKEIEGS